jgi:5,10-methylenetetrahydromethanopterin reductase
MGKLYFDIRVPVGAPLPELAEFIARSEDAGFDGVGVHDHPHAGRDAYIALALAAERTRRLRLYPATSSPNVRHPLLLASLAHSLDEIGPGRIALTVAPGFLAVRNIGRPRATLAGLREAILALRRLLAGQSTVVDGTEMRLRNVSGQPPAVYLLAAGPRMVELAGEVADGALLFVGLDPEAITRAREHLASGARRAGRSLNGFKTIFGVTLALEADPSAWLHRDFAPGQPWLSYPSASNWYWLEAAGLSASSPETELAHAFGLFGSPEHCRDRLQEAQSISGVDHVFLFPAHTLETGYDLPTRELEAFARVIRPAL